MPSRFDVCVVGAGVVGIFTAYLLAKRGFSVCLVDRGEPGFEASRYNAGLVVPSMALAELHRIEIRRAIRWLLDAASPVKVNPSQLLREIKWILDFMRMSNIKLEEALEVLRKLGELSISTLERIIKEEKIECRYSRVGVVEVYVSGANLEEAWDTVRKRLSADRVKLLNRDSLPPFVKDVAGGILYVGDACLAPDLLIDSLVGLLRSVYEVKVMSKTEVYSISTDANSLTTSAGELAFGDLVVSAGPWTGDLLKSIGASFKVVPAKGYCVILRKKDSGVDMPLMFEEYGVAVNPSNSPLIRLTGFFELAGFDKSIPEARIEQILGRVFSHVPELGGAEVVASFSGLRPCLSFRLPITARHPRYRNLYIATGHCRLGITLAAGSAELVSRMIAGEELPFDASVLSFPK